MTEPDGKEHHEIIVVHRHGDHEDGHHGGAWKIAFADFMTALMAFFLVMWLINSTDEQTLSQVATYFSPIKLTDREMTKRGVHDSQFGGSGKEKEKNDPKKKEGKEFLEPRVDPGVKHFPEEELFADPYDKLSKLAVQATRNPPRPGGGLKDEGRSGGDAFRDPFDPEFRSNVDEGPIAGADAKLKAGTAQGVSGQGSAAIGPEPRLTPDANSQPGPEMAVHPPHRGKADEKTGDAFGESQANAGRPGRLLDSQTSENQIAGEQRSPVSKRLASAEENPEGDGELVARGGIANTGDKGGQPEIKGAGVKPVSGHSAEKPDAAEGKEEASSEETLEKTNKQAQGDAKEMRRLVETNNEAREIEREFIESVKQSNLAFTPDINVIATPDGVLISLTDKRNFEMFAVGSAEPRPELVVVMEKLGKVLQTQKGDIIIRGHTDSRPYRSKIYDNWRLSTSRAHMSYYMLVRAGIPKKRIERIEGYADHSPRNPKNPRAAENRRIEILLRPPKA